MFWKRRMNLSNIRYVFGDAAYPDVSSGPVMLAHVCNDVGKILDDRLGQICFDSTPADADHIILVNMVAQHGVGTSQIRVSYPALHKCLKMLAEVAKEGMGGPMIPVHMPRIGCGLAGGRWEVVEPIIRETLVRAGVEVVVYDLPQAQTTSLACGTPQLAASP